METKKAEPLAHGEEQDKRTFDFTTLLLLSLKRKLYDRLKQGCFRLGYRPNKDLLLKKHISKPEDDEDDSRAVEPSETSVVTDRSNSVKSDVFYLCDGQWRSGDWQSVGVNTVTRRQNSTTVVRRRRHMSPSKALDENLKARVSAVSEFNNVQTFLPWFLPWILTLLTFLLTERPSQHQLHKQRKERNLKAVRSQQYRATHRRKNSGMKAILPNRSSSVLLLATSLPTETQKSSKGSRVKRRITKQCAAVAKVNRMPITGLPPHPRLIMTPPSSPRLRTSASEEAAPEERSTSPMEKKIAPKVDDLQPFKILSQSPKKIVIELEGVEQLQGLLSKQFAEQEGNKVELVASPIEGVKDSDTVCDTEASGTLERCLANCSGRVMDDMASEDVGTTDKRQTLVSKPSLSRKAQAINILKAKKARDMELARSRESQGSTDTPKSSQTDREDNSREASDVEPMPNSVSSSFMEEFFCEHLENPISRSSSTSISRPLESDTSICSATSTSTVDSGVPSMSAQTWKLVRQNSRVLATDESFSSTVSHWPSIDEETSLDAETSKTPIPTEKVQADDEKEKEDKLTLLRMWNPDIKPAASKKSVSPFSVVNDQQAPVMPKPQEPLPSAEAASTRSPSQPEKSPVQDGSITEARRLPKKPPPPPPPPKSKEKSVTESATNKPPPPAKGGMKGKKGPAPPPPPPGSNKRNGKGGSGIVRAPKVIEMFQAVRKATKGKSSHKRHKTIKEAPADNSKLQSEGSGGDALIKELEKNSRYFAQIQSDVETHGPAIQKMIIDINSRKFETMSEMNSFVKKIDNVLETFADETAVLRQFDWPHKYYIYREALALWSELKNRTDKCRHWVQGTRGISGELHRMKKYMELNIRRMDEVQRTLEPEVKKFIRNGIPWDSSVIQKVHDGTMCLLEKYMQIVYDEVSRTQAKPTHREKNVQFLTETINLTFKIHQFVGGLTESCTSLFEKIAAFTRTLNTDL